MGANEKHEATYHGREYTPGTDSARRAYVFHTAGLKSPPQERAERREHEFDRWLEAVRAEAKAEALEDFAKVIDAEERDQWIQDGIRRPGAQIVAGRMKVLRKVARNRANRYKEQS